MRSTLFAVACAGIVASTPVMAKSTTASVELGRYSYQLIDLDLTDGITPSITIRSGGGPGGLQFHAYANGTDQWWQSQSGLGSTTLTHSLGSTSGTISAAGTLAEASMSTSAKWWSTFWTKTGMAMDFKLTPSTGLLITSTFDLDVENAGKNAAATAWARLNGWTRLPNSDSNSYVSSFLEYREVTDGSLTETISGYLYSGSQTVNGHLEVVGVSTIHTVTPVPEPSTWMMLLGGLALLAHGLRKGRN